MNETTKNKTLPIMIIVLALAITGIYFFNQYENSKPHLSLQENYLVEAKLGILPMAQSRQPLANDIDTGLRAMNGNQEYALIKSNNLQTLDFGKVFAVRIA